MAHEGRRPETENRFRETHRGDDRRNLVRAHDTCARKNARAVDLVTSRALKDKGLLISRDGLRWTAPAPPESEVLPVPALNGERISFGKLIMDLHTGKAFFGKDAEWIWIDVLGSVWIFLGFTGIYLWWRTQTKRRDAARKQYEATNG